MEKTVREIAEEREKEYLSPLAVKSVDGVREVKEDECPLRTCFQRDSDRIIHSKAFRRLKHKTQVFLSPEGDHYRTRLTHTLEVNQIARTIARALGLNEYLTEATALGHDLGHSPFGHAGERALNEVSPLGFSHNEQSVRVAKRLEKDGRGLNLTLQCLDGIMWHCEDGAAATLEGQIVRYADVIAFINHDIDDAVRGKVLSKEDLPKDIIAVVGDRHSVRIGRMIEAAVNKSRENMEKAIKDGAGVTRGIIDLEPEVREATFALKQFMFDRVYLGSEAKKEEGKAIEIVKILYEYFVSNPDRLTGEYRAILEAEGPDRAALDMVASMSDSYAVRLFSEIYIPKKWQLL